MSKLPHVGTTIFTTMSKLATDHQAINLSQGFPNFPVDPLLISILKEQADENVHQYMPMPGSPALLNHVSALIERSYGRTISTETELLITAGATQAIFTTILALINSGDEVLILDPSYDCYEPAVLLAGGKPVHVSLDANFLPDWNAIGAAVNKNTRMIITNNPHNPTGRVWTEDDMSTLESLVQQHEQLLVLSDEVYEFIVFENRHISANERTLLQNRSIIVSSFGKTFHITGWKIGYVVAPAELMREIRKVHQFNVFSVNSLSQATLANYLQHTDVSVLGEFYRKKRDLFQQLMKESRFKLLPCEGTYFQTADYSAISELNDLDFCRELTISHGVAAIPISVFNADATDRKIIRFCFAKDEQTLINASEKLCRI